MSKKKKIEKPSPKEPELTPPVEKFSDPNEGWRPGKIDFSKWYNRKGELLTTLYMADYKKAIKNFTPKFVVEFTDHLLACLDLGETYLKDSTDENWKLYYTKETDFLKKHGSTLHEYWQLNMYRYFGSEIIFAERDDAFNVPYNNFPPEHQSPNQQDFLDFVKHTRRILEMERDIWLLRQEPLQEGLGNVTPVTKEVEARTSRGKIKRGPNDTFTSLSQEQTVLLLYYLQKERAFLKDEYLDATDAGIAFEILTGYSHNTIRQKLSKFNHYQTPENFKALTDLFSRIISEIKKD